jgi:sarcosine oxidase subunit beta
VADLDIGQYLRPQIGGTWLVGGTEPECDELHWVDDPDTLRRVPDGRAVRGVDDASRPARARVRRAHRPVGLAALYDVADDWVPIYDKSDLPGFFMACGTSGNQFKNAPLAGQFMARHHRRRGGGGGPRRVARAVHRRPHRAHHQPRGVLAAA